MSKRSGRYAILLGTFWRDPKIEVLSPEAAGVFCKCLSYCADMMTDGYVPAEVVRGFCSPRKRVKTIDELTAPIVLPSGLKKDPLFETIYAERDSLRDRYVLSYRIVKYTERNLSRQGWEQLKEIDRNRKQLLTEQFRGGIRPESVRKKGGNPSGPSDTRTPGHQDSLKRERSDHSSQSNSKKQKSKGYDPHQLVVMLWDEVGKQQTGDPNIATEAGPLRTPADKLYKRAVALNQQTPLAALEPVFEYYWKQQLDDGKWPNLAFMLNDFDAIRAKASGKLKRSAKKAAEDHEIRDDPVSRARDKLGLENEINMAKKDLAFCLEQGDQEGIRRNRAAIARAQDELKKGTRS